MIIHGDPREVTSEEFVAIRSLLDNCLSSYGFETSPLLMRWYNDQVADKFKFNNLDENCLAFCVISVAHMFEKGFLPFLFENKCHNQRNALDEAIEFYLRGATDQLKEYSPLHYKDSDMAPGTRRPSFLAQPAAHVSGTAFYYHPSHIISSAVTEGVELPWKEEDSSRVFGVSIHPKYGGWFAVRGLIILQNVKYSALQFTPPVDVIQSTRDKLTLLKDFNFDNWKNWKYRDIVPVESSMKYSAIQKKYFETEPKLRFETLQTELYSEYMKQRGNPPIYNLG